MAAWGRTRRGSPRAFKREAGPDPHPGGDGTPGAGTVGRAGLEGQVRIRGGRLERTFPERRAGPGRGARLHESTACGCGIQHAVETFGGKQHTRPEEQVIGTREC